MTNKKNAKKIKKSVMISGLVASGLSIVSLSALAGERFNDYPNRHQAFDYAKVTKVTPIIERYQVNQPVEKCWTERVRVRDEHSRKKTYTRTPEIIGGILGAAAGRKFGNGRGKDLATVAGVVLGASIGRDIKNRNRAHTKNHYEPVRYENIQHCETQDSYIERQNTVGYDVEYQYLGRHYQTTLDYDPGNKIKVSVNVDPVR